MKKPIIILLLLTLSAGCSSITKPGNHGSPLSALSSVHPLSSSQTPNDPLYGQQGYLSTANIPQAWQVTHGSNSQKIALITMGGVNKNHEDLSSRVDIKRAASSSFANNGAADPEAGIIGAATNNGKGIAGVNWNSQLLSYNIGKKITTTAYRLPNGVPVNNPETFVGLDKSAVGPAVNQAVNAGAKTILLPIIWMKKSYIPNVTLDSLEIYPSFKVKAPSLMLVINDIKNIIQSITASNKASSSFKSAENAVIHAYDQGSVVVTMPSAYHGQITGFPGDLSSDHIVFTVGSSNLSARPFQFSGTPEADNISSGPEDINLIAPGVNMETTLAGNHAYGKVSGTGTSAALAAGVISLMQSVQGDLTPDDIRHVLQKTAAPVGGGGYHKKSGYGLIDAGAALEYVKNHNIKHGTLTSGKVEQYASNKKTTLFKGTPWSTLPPGVYIATKLDKVTFTIPLVPSSSNDLWVDLKGTYGWSTADPNDQGKYAHVKLYDDHATVTTYIYDLYGIDGGKVGWYPTSPDNIQLHYSYVGEKPHPLGVTINGPVTLSSGQVATWTADVSNSRGTNSYQWYRKNAAGDPWQQVNITTASYQTYFDNTTSGGINPGLKVKVISGSQTATATLSLFVQSSNCNGATTMTAGISPDNITPCTN